MTRKLAAAAILLATLAAAPAAAEIPAEGWFLATADCPATVSIRKGDNPGDVTARKGSFHALAARNADPATHYLIVVEGADPQRRWVARECGMLAAAMPQDDTAAADLRGPVVKAVEPQSVETVQAAQEPKAEKPKRERRQKREREGQAREKPKKGGRADHVLAFSWQPAFCETQERKPECVSQTGDRFDATNFSLHGLWPQPRRREYCGLDDAVIALDKQDWNALPPVEISDATRAELEKVMPGVQSALDRHEWVKHGTCYKGGGAQAYYDHSLALMRAINASPVRELFAANVGKRLRNADIRAAFDKAFGEGAGERVRVACAEDGERRIIVEITIGLSGEIGDAPDLARLMAAAPPTGKGCPAGIVDPVGLQ
jgi:ribonuclease T2